MEPTHPFLRACLRLPVDRTPVWLMRQAGRYLPEYRATRAQAGDFLALCQNPELATEVTLQPLRRYALDAAILFSDILVVPMAMGQQLRFSTGEGPLLEPVIQSRKDVDRLIHPDPETHLGYVLATVRSIRSALADRVPLIGFSGSPWTLATYMVEGGSSKNFSRIKAMLYNDPDLLEHLLNRLADAVADYLNAQIAHGAQAVQIFDTWGGVLAPEDFLRFSLASMQRVMQRLHRVAPDGARVPVILFAKGCSAMAESLAETGCDMVGLDWTARLGAVRQRVGERVALQGNLDPAVLYAAPERIHAAVRRTLEDFGPHPGHVFNLGHGVAPDMHPDHVAALVDAVGVESRRIHSGGQA
ncbi:MAG: uroporphyrinogen decarboxylase [Magnetococcus sp. WYHC-3]